MIWAVLYVRRVMHVLLLIFYIQTLTHPLSFVFVNLLKFLVSEYGSQCLFPSYQYCPIRCVGNDFISSMFSYSVSVSTDMTTARKLFMDINWMALLPSCLNMGGTRWCLHTLCPINHFASLASYPHLLLYCHCYLHFYMSYSNPMTSSSTNFQLIFNNALEAYNKHTKNDLLTHPVTTAYC